MASLSVLHAHTPTLAVIEPRGLPVRLVSFHRTAMGDAPSERVERSAYDASGRLVDRWDPRLWAAASQRVDVPSNLNSVFSLSGALLRGESVDAGWRVDLPNESGFAVSRWLEKGHARRFEYDQSMRPVAVFDTDGQHETCAERMTYGAADAEFGNQCGQLIRQDDLAGSAFNVSYSLSGSVTHQTRRLLNDMQPPNWPADASERDALLADGEGYSTRWAFAAAGEVIKQTDAMGHVRLSLLNQAGQLKGSLLQLSGKPLQRLAGDISYDALGRVESEVAGNGLITKLTYDAVDGRLARLSTDEGRLQDLHYAFDPVGNVVSIEDRAQPTRYFANQEIEPLRTFAYDTLYQLIEATGYESAVAHRGPDAREFSSATELSNYTQRYEYDAGGNMQKMTHTGAQNHTRLFATAQYSNRTLLQTGDRPPSEDEIAQGFDAAGNLRELAPGQRLNWDLRNQLSEVNPVERESAANDSEVYRYDAAGMRVRKVRVMQAKAVTHLSEVRYLPGLEIRTNRATGEVLHVIVVKAGRSDVRILHWQAGQPAGIDNDQIRYSLSDHLGSSTLELDQQGKLISHEVYYPYGETAWFAARSEVEATYKTVRYSGKERDATGLYYYGLRYYASCFMRWFNPDPGGQRGGLNLFRFVNNSPLRYLDMEGEAPYDVLTEEELELYETDSTKVVARGLSEFTREQRVRFKVGAILAIELLKINRAELSRPVLKGRTNKVFNALFGALDTDIKGQVLASLKDGMAVQQDYIQDLLGGSGWKVSLLEHRERAGISWHTTSYMPEATIALSTEIVEAAHPLGVANILIHEASHATQDTDDYFYNKLSWIDEGSTVHEIKKYSKPCWQLSN